MRTPGILLSCAAIAAGAAFLDSRAARAQVNPANLQVRAGTWAYAATPFGSEASYLDASGRAQMTIRCVRSTRRVGVSMRAVAVPSMLLWTTSASRNLPTSYNPATGLLTAQLAAADPLLDAIAFSRGQFSVTVQGLSPLAVPAWAEPARAIEDCRN